MVDARHAELYSPAIGAAGNVVVHGHWGRPFLAFPAERGNAWEYGDRGVVGARTAPAWTLPLLRSGQDAATSSDTTQRVGPDG